MVDADIQQAHVLVPSDQLSLAIGKEGQNVRLAARLTGWKIDIKDADEYYAAEDAGQVMYVAPDRPARVETIAAPIIAEQEEDLLEDLEELEDFNDAALEAFDFDAEFAIATPDSLAAAMADDQPSEE